MEIPEIVKREVKKIDKQAQVILFGSRARGDQSGESDWDFLILLSVEDTEIIKRQISDKLFEIELETEEIISSLIENQQKWNHYKVTPLFKNIEKEGLFI